MVVAITNGKDAQAGRLVVKFKQASSSSGNSAGDKFAAGRYCAECCLVAGGGYSYAIFGVPMRSFGAGAWDEIAPTVAMRSNGPASIKLKRRAKVEYLEGNNAAPIMNGWLVSYTHDINEDSMVGQVFDDRWMLTKFTVFGRSVFDPSTGKYYWDGAAPTIFNELGFPNCIDTPVGPRFAPCHRFGYTNDFRPSNSDLDSNGGFNEDYDEPTVASTRARSWTCKDIIRYLRDVFYTQEGSGRVPFPVYVGNMTLPEDIIWPEGLGSVLEQDRQPKHYNLTNASLLDALQQTASYAGPYDLYCSPKGGDDFKSVLEFKKMNPSEGQGITLYTPERANDLAAAMSGVGVMKSLQLTESCIDAFDETVIIGDGPTVERMCSTAPAAGGTVGAGKLEGAWASEDETEFKNYCNDFGNGSFGSPIAFGVATRLWPLVYCGYRIPKGADIWAGTKWAGKFNGGYPRMKTSQLSGTNENVTNPRNWQPREIVVEYERQYAQEVDSSSPSYDEERANEKIWYEAARFDNLSLTADSTIVLLSALRDQSLTGGSTPQSWVSTSFGDAEDGTYNGDRMVARNVRLQLALEADWPLTGIKGNGGTPEDDPNKVYARMEEEPRTSYQIVAGSGDYIEWLRHSDSRPAGQAGYDAIDDFDDPVITSGGFRVTFPARATEANELFTDRVNATSGRLPAHAQQKLKTVKRVAVSGSASFEAVCIGMTPGLHVSIEGTSTIPAIAVIKSVTFRAEAEGDEGQTTIEFGPPDAGVLSSPVPIMHSGGSAGAVASSGGSGGGKSGGDTPNSGGGGDSGYTEGQGKSPDSYSSPVSSGGSGYKDEGYAMAPNGTQSAPVEDDYETSSSGKTKGSAGARGIESNFGRKKSSGQILVDPSFSPIQQEARAEIEKVAGAMGSTGQGKYEDALKYLYGKDTDTYSAIEGLKLGDNSKDNVADQFTKRSAGIYKTNDDGFERKMGSMQARNNKGRGIFGEGNARQSVGRQFMGNALDRIYGKR